VSYDWSLEFQEDDHFEDAGFDYPEDNDHVNEWGENSSWNDFS